MTAQISQFGKCIQHKMIKSFSEQNVGVARPVQAQVRSPSVTMAAVRHAVTE